MVRRKIRVVHFQRKPRAGENFSLEFIFNNVRMYLAEKVDFRVVVVRYESNGFLKRVRNILYAYKYQGDVNHITGDIHYISLLFSQRRTILTILDCGFMNSDSRLKRLIFLWFWLKIPVWKSRHITTISEASKRDIIRYTGCPPDKIEVIPVAVSELYKPVPKEFNEACPVLLQIGTAYNKNLERLFEAIAAIHCKLVIIGKLDEQKLKLLEQYNIAFENKTNLTNDEVYLEYQKCDLVTFVSTYEGFGMPIIEANWVERPIIAGKNSSMIQVANDAALLVDAHSVEDIREGIQRLISDAPLRQHLIERGRLNRKLYSGQQLAERYYVLYKQVFDDNVRRERDVREGSL